MKNYAIVSKIAFVICSVLIVLAVVNEITGFINSAITFSGTVFCIVGLFIAIFAIIILEKEREKRKSDKSC